jgi:PAS domain S-box-containing protein
MAPGDDARLADEAQRTIALLDSLFESAPIALGFWDTDLRYVRVNPALAALNGLPIEAHPGRTILEVIPDVGRVVEPLARRVLETGEAAVGVGVSGTTPFDPHALRHWVVTYFPVRDDGGEIVGVGAVVEEVTERRAAEASAVAQHRVAATLAVAAEIEDALPQVLDDLCGYLGWDVAAYWSTDVRRALEVRVRPGAAFPGFVAATQRAELATGLFPARVAATGEGIWIDEIENQPLARAPVAAAEGLTSAAGIPVVVDGEVAGVLEAFSSRRRPHDDQMLGTLAAVGRQLAQFLRRRRVEEERRALLERERRAREQAEAAAATLEKLARVAQVTLEHLSLVDLLGALLARIVEVLDADTGSILLLDERDGMLHVRAVHGLEEERARREPVPFGEGVAGRVAATRAPLLIDDLASVDVVGSVLQVRGVRSLVAIPLVVEDRVIGVVHTGSLRPGAFASEDAGLLQLIADRIALAINQAALVDAERRAQARLAVLAEASAILSSSLDVETTLRGLAAAVVPAHADWCAVDVVDERGIRRVAVASVPGSDASAAAERFPPTLGGGDGSGRAIRTGEAQLAAVIDAGGVRSAVVVPLVARGDPVGALTLAWLESDRRYDEDDLRFAETLAMRAAVALDNARLYREAEERAQAARVLASVGDGVFLVDRSGVVRTWNRAAETATGLPAAEVVDRPAVAAIPGWRAIAARIPVGAPGASAGRAESLPLDLGTRELWLSIHAVVVPDGVVYAFRDLTEERALEELKTEFVSTVSHELRTPLAAIYGAAMTLRRGDVDLPEEQRENLLGVVASEADRLARTVNDILWASRLDTGTMRVAISRCDPVALARDVVEAQRTHLDAAHEVRLTPVGRLPEVSADPDKVRQVLVNLVDNGVKYSRGGVVDVRLEEMGGRVRFSVSDEGIGIPVAEQRRIFEKFYRLDPNMAGGVGGTGLGLYICRELVRRMDGRIWVESGGGTGTTFHVELPVAR